MKDLINLYDLMIEQLRDLYDGELQQKKVLPKFKKEAESERLQDIIGAHIRDTKHQITRLEEIFSNLSEKPEGEHCKGMKGLIKEALQLIERSADPEVLDAGLITSLQHINHYEIAGYGTAIAYAKALGNHTLAANLLHSLREEKRSDEELSDLALGFINRRAKRTGIAKKFF